MATVQVRDLPEEVADEFRKRAAAAGQSLQSYLRQYLIEAASRGTKQDYVALIEERLAASTAPGATAESIDEVLRDARGE